MENLHCFITRSRPRIHPESDIKFEDLVAETNEDRILSPTRQAIIDRKQEQIPLENQYIQNGLGTALYGKKLELGLVLYGTKTFLTITLRRWLLNAPHKNHCGIGKTKEESKLAKWPNTDANIHH